MAVKQAIDLVPWADAVYGCDGPWWQWRKALPEFKGLKICWSGNGLEAKHDVLRVDIKKIARDQYSDELCFDRGTIGGGGNSGFQALNLALQFGARHIILIGFDMHDRGGVHYYGRNNWPMSSNPDATCFPRWIRAFAKVAPQIAALGARVINASETSDLTCFPKMSLERALAA